MEPTRFDRLIQDKLAQANELHANEISNSKPFVWSSVQTNLNKNKSGRWKSLMAAAVFIFLIFSSFLLYRVGLSHQYEVSRLSAEIERINQLGQEQEKDVVDKDQQIAELSKQIASIEAVMLAQRDIPNEAPRIVYRRDTVIVREIEYITQVPLKIDSISSSNIQNDLLDESVNNNQQNKVVKSNFIYPSFENTKQMKDQNESIKIKLTSLVSN